ncbi:MAG TPA: hypothetical protein VF210_10520 [Pseudomonadales bacterium]
MIRWLTILIALTSLAGCSEPFVVFSGGTLSGEERPPPEDWSALADEETVQLETRPADPYSVNIWAVSVERDVYVATGADGTRWTGFIGQDPRVRLRVGQTLYPLRAVRVTDREEQEQVARAYADKYELDPEDNWVREALVYRLEPR